MLLSRDVSVALDMVLAISFMILVLVRVDRVDSSSDLCGGEGREDRVECVEREGRGGEKGSD